MSDATGLGKRPSRQELYRIALYQKGLLLCVLLLILAFIGRFLAITNPGSPFVLEVLMPVYRFLGPSFFGIGLEHAMIQLVGAVFALLLALKVYGIPAGIALGILLFAPYVGLIVLLLINGGASSVLQKNGFRVGLLGAKLSQFRDNDEGE